MAAPLSDPTTLLPPSLLPPLSTGKVRTLHALPSDPSHLLFLASDRVSAYDAVLSTPIPAKGALLTAMTRFWLTRVLPGRVAGLRTHLDDRLPAATEATGEGDEGAEDDPLAAALRPAVESASAARRLAASLGGRALVVRRARVLPVESIVRGHITGSAWVEYRERGTVHGVAMPAGLREGEEIPGGGMWTPSTKAGPGEKDENISPERARGILGRWAGEVERLSVECYKVARGYAREKGIVIADTKFEFGVVPVEGKEGEEALILIDEVLTPDSSRFWPLEDFEVGRRQRSFDKQVLRDWLTKNGLKGKEGVELPVEVVEETAARYREAYERLIGEKWVD